MGMVVLAAECFCSGMAVRTTSEDAFVAWQLWRLRVVSLIPGFWLLFSLSYARGSAWSLLARWRIPVFCAFALPVATVTGFGNGLIESLSHDKSALHLLPRLGWSGTLLYILVLVSSVAVLMNLERTYRASVGTMRWRIKFMLLAVCVLFIIRFYTSSQALLFRAIDLPSEDLDSVALLVAGALMLRSFPRVGDSDLDVHPSRSFLQSSVTIVLTGTYLLIVGALAKVVAYLGGDTSFEFKALVVLVALVALAVAAQSDRVRLHVRRFVSRYFQRPIYDYRTIWRKFTESTSSVVDQGDLCRALVRLVADTFQALSVAIWLTDDRREAFSLAASTSLPEGVGQSLAPAREEAVALIEHFQAGAEPVDIEAQTRAWAVTLKRMHPSDFTNGGHRICVPLIERGHLMGLMMIGDRVGGVPYSTQDMEMLLCMGDHASGSLLNARYSSSLLQAKEFEAFQAMAAFFVHDLKNAASTLNLMLQNLPVHYDDPTFREDTLRGVGKTVDHINHLVSRLSLLRHELKIEASETDLNEVVSKAIEGLALASAAPVSTEYSTLPRINLDRQQISKVITNLVLNAIEATPSGRRVHVSTHAELGWAIIRVEDNGCGMSAEFIRDSLFRPFKTTKKNGLGIGMFQSRMIVEAHRGRIALSSEPDRGTTFQVFLPAPANSK